MAKSLSKPSPRVRDTQNEGTANSLEKMLGLLDLYTPSSSALTADQMAVSVGCSRATIYRYVKALTNSGLLAPAAGGTYVLGARIIQLDRQIRLSDPLLAASRERMTSLAKRIAGNLILCSFYGSHVICVHEEWIDHSFTTSYVRGRPMPLFLGAVSKVILANLPAYKQRSLMLHHANEIAAAGLGPTWLDFKKKLKEIRKAGYCVATAEVDPGLTGIAVPLFGSEGQIAGALCLIQSARRTAEKRLESVLVPLLQTGAEISGALDTNTKGKKTKSLAPVSRSLGSRRRAS